MRVDRSGGGAVLGLEASCDETAAAVVRAGDGAVLAEAVLGQEKEHAPFGGVVPEIAARAHLEHLPRLAERVPLGRELARPRLEPRDLRLQLPALGLLLREGVPARLELCAGGGKLALKPAHRVAVVIQVVRHHLHVGRGDPERDDGYEKHRYHRLPARQ